MELHKESESTDTYISNSSKHKMNGRQNELYKIDLCFNIGTQQTRTVSLQVLAKDLHKTDMNTYKT